MWAVGLSFLWPEDLPLVWLVRTLSVLTERMPSGGLVVLLPGWIVNLPALKVMGLLLVWAVGPSTLKEVILLLGGAAALFPVQPAGLPLVWAVGLSPVWAEDLPQALGFQQWHGWALAS